MSSRCHRPPASQGIAFFCTSAWGLSTTLCGVWGCLGTSLEMTLTIGRPGDRREKLVSAEKTRLHDA